MKRSWEENELEAVFNNPGSTPTEKSLAGALLRLRSAFNVTLEHFGGCKKAIREILGKVRDCPRCGKETSSYGEIFFPIESFRRQNLPPGFDVGLDGEVTVSGIPVEKLWHLHHDLKKAFPDILMEYPNLSIFQLDAAIRYAESQSDELGDEVP